MSESMSAPVMRQAGRGNRWRPGCQPQPTDSTSPPVERQPPPEQLALAQPLLLVVELERRLAVTAVEQVASMPVHAAQARSRGARYQAPRRLNTAGTVFSRIDRSRKTDQRSR